MAIKAKFCPLVADVFRHSVTRMPEDIWPNFAWNPAPVSVVFQSLAPIIGFLSLSLIIVHCIIVESYIIYQLNGRCRSLLSLLSLFIESLKLSTSYWSWCRQICWNYPLIIEIFTIYNQLSTNDSYSDEQRKSFCVDETVFIVI